MEKLAKFILVLFIGAFAQLGYAQKAISTKESNRYTIEDCVNTFDVNKAVKTKSGYQYWFADKKNTEENTLKMSIVEPGKSTHEPHRHPEEEFFYILEGKATFYLDGNTVEAGPNTSLYCPPNAEHGISNAGNSNLKYLVIKKDLR
ncbi:cupin domain-containing protein [Chryseobacterium chendengshani]|uniref:cupin domain-containing protein n=1 Tax=Chryseobacterium sp. LJ668 TaxID=2864040 RepID=UPI001C68D6B5|nr:cupin domain-containing protein [Chryseobacterium sp. LJ668]MBW8522910.1 cupin domain-containing protein [Chryseobacterium sp. LJ668]QYK16439.1 cupin domain-containing protein [Chryseobacterium sp. LJ668]